MLQKHSRVSAEFFASFSFFGLQEMKKAILSDMTKLGKESGLKSFEQVKVPTELPQMKQCNLYMKVHFYQGNLLFCCKNL